MQTRRHFLATTLGAGAVLAAGPQAALPQPARKRVIVDAQIHVWKAESDDWKWVSGAKPQMSEPFTIEKAVPLMDEAGVDRAVIVPPSWPGDRNDYGIEAAKRYPDRFAVMGRIPLQDPNSATLLPKWA
jgi:predicted TIM-barrel fold metal-dependent hydrolase